jgi:hypothetical protein
LSLLGAARAEHQPARDGVRRQRVDDSAWQRFIRTIERRGRGRITMIAHLLFDGRQVASFEGDFVACEAEVTARDKAE